MTVNLVPIKAPSSDTGSDFDGDALQLSGIKINSLGEITGTILAPGEAYDGKTVSLGKVAIATFQNPQGLSKRADTTMGLVRGITPVRSLPLFREEVRRS